MKSFLTLISVIAAWVGVCAATPAVEPEITCDWNKAEHFSGDSLQKLMEHTSFSPNWVDGTPYFYYSTRQGGATRYKLVNAATGAVTPLIKNPERFAHDFTRLTGDTVIADNIPVYSLKFKDGKTDSFTFRRKGKYYRHNIRNGSLRAIKEPKDAGTEGRPIKFRTEHTNADSTYTIMGCEYDLYCRDNKTGVITRLTSDGKKDASHTYSYKPDTLETNASGWWMGNRFIQPVYDQSEILETGFIETVGHTRPKVNSFRMPMPGDEGVKQTRIYWFNPETGEGRYLPIEKYPDQVVDINYHRSDDYLYFTRRSRGADHIDLCRIYAPDGSVTELISEECKPHMNMSLFNYRLLDDGNTILWWSERTGRGNYYLYDRDGRELNRITRGDNLVAGHVVKMDSANNAMIFIGYGQEPDVNPYHPMYYSARFDGSSQTLLTPGDYHHDLKMSPDGRYAVDIFSRMDLAPSLATVVIDNPAAYTVVDTTDITPLREAGWRPPVLFTVKAADGVTDLPGVMYLPSDLDPDKKYPIITNVYPGPQDDQIFRNFVIDDNYNQSLAELGFVVITAPSRGSSPLRGRDFYTYGYGNFRDYPLEDDRNTIMTLASRYPFIDLDRVGIYGHSGGGFQTVAAMLNYPDFYKVGVAASGNHDNNIYIQNWGEIFHGITEETDSVTGKTVFKTHIPTNPEIAGNLKGRLMLITGDVDKNVSPSHTYRLADALIKKGKRFDMFVLPGKDHGVMCPYYYNLIRYYFVDHLLSPTPYHLDIINHQ